MTNDQLMAHFQVSTARIVFTCCLIFIGASIDYAIFYNLFYLLHQDPYGQISATKKFMVSISAASGFFAIIPMKEVINRLMKESDSIYYSSRSESVIFWGLVVLALTALFMMYHLSGAANLSYASSAALNLESNAYYTPEIYYSDLWWTRLILVISTFGIAYLYASLERDFRHQKRANQLKAHEDLILEQQAISEQLAIKQAELEALEEINIEVLISSAVSHVRLTYMNALVWLSQKLFDNDFSKFDEDELTAHPQLQYINEIIAIKGKEALRQRIQEAWDSLPGNQKPALELLPFLPVEYGKNVVNLSDRKREVSHDE